VVEPSVKVTVPVGVGWPVDPATVAWIVTGWPGAAGWADEVSAIVVSNSVTAKGTDALTGDAAEGEADRLGVAAVQGEGDLADPGGGAEVVAHRGGGPEGLSLGERLGRAEEQGDLRRGKPVFEGLHGEPGAARGRLAGGGRPVRRRAVPGGTA
jgi:hypothetical protein